MKYPRGGFEIRLSSVRLVHFRRFERFEVGSFHPRLNVIVGKNAQGKTSVLEALFLITQLKSFRTHSSLELIQEGHSQASVQVITEDPTASRVLVSLEGNKKTVRIDDKNVSRRGNYDFLGSGISFVPDDLHLIKAGPEGRRHFFDELSVTVDPTSDSIIQNFHKILKQRNRLIKAIRDKKTSLSHLSLWTDQFIDAGLRVYQLRAELVERCAHILPSIYHQLFKVSETLKLSYQTGFENNPPSVDDFAQRLGRLGEAEIAAGYSLVGPHRDDYLFELEGRDARSYASQGQTRGIVIALKVAQMELAQTTKNGAPILLLDDIISELDEERVKSLVGYLAAYPGQLFVTTAETSKLKTLHQQFPEFKLIDLENELLGPSEQPLNMTS